jgi:hypothetical protein
MRANGLFSARLPEALRCPSTPFKLTGSSRRYSHRWSSRLELRLNILKNELLKRHCLSARQCQAIAQCQICEHIEFPRYSCWMAISLWFSSGTNVTSNVNAYTGRLFPWDNEIKVVSKRDAKRLGPTWAVIAGRIESYDAMQCPSSVCSCPPLTDIKIIEWTHSGDLWSVFQIKMLTDLN